MWGWLNSWFRPTAKKIEVVPSTKEEKYANLKEELKEKSKEKPTIVYTKGRHTLSPLRILEWWGQPITLDPIPPFPEDPDAQKINVPQ